LSKSGCSTGAEGTAVPFPELVEERLLDRRRRYCRAVP